MPLPYSLRRLSRTLLRLALALVLAAGVVAATTSTAKADQPLYVLHFNMAGSAANNGGLYVAERTAESINTRQSNLVTLVEVCRSQYNEVRRLTGYDGYFLPTKSSSFAETQPYWYAALNCEGGKGDYGIAVLASESVSNEQWRTLTDPDSEREYRRVLCALVTGFDRQIELCVTHIRPQKVWQDQYVIEKQIKEATDWVNGFPTVVNRPTIFAGDFNRTPKSPALDRVYSSYFDDGFGNFSEIDQYCGTGGALDRCGATTLDSGGKVDYIFYSKGDFCCPIGNVTEPRPDSLSDHKLLTGKLTLRF